VQSANAGLPRRYGLGFDRLAAAREQVRRDMGLPFDQAVINKGSYSFPGSLGYGYVNAEKLEAEAEARYNSHPEQNAIDYANTHKKA